MLQDDAAIEETEEPLGVVDAAVKAANFINSQIPFLQNHLEIPNSVVEVLWILSSTKQLVRPTDSQQINNRI